MKNCWCNSALTLNRSTRLNNFASRTLQRASNVKLAAKQVLFSTGCFYYHTSSTRSAWGSPFFGSTAWRDRIRQKCVDFVSAASKSQRSGESKSFDAKKKGKAPFGSALTAQDELSSSNIKGWARTSPATGSYIQLYREKTQLCDCCLERLAQISTRRTYLGAAIRRLYPY
jgi:hypothetical protein